MCIRMLRHTRRKKTDSSMSYIKPDDVHSPRRNWTLIAVLDEGQERGCALAIGRWTDKWTKGKIYLAMRWNGHEENPVGNPQSRGLPTWMMIDEKYHEALLTSGTLAPDKLAVARAFIPEPK